jgi:hypothetical protein
MVRALTLVSIILASLATTAQSFVVVQRNTNSVGVIPITTALYGRARRGGLGKVASETGVTPSKVRTPKSSSSRKKGKTSSSSSSKGDAAISPALAEWMASQQENGSDAGTTSVEREDTVEEASSSATFEVFSDGSKSKNARRIKQSARKEMEAQRNSQVSLAIEGLEEALEENGNLNGILDSIRKLVSLPSESPRTIFASSRRNNYRLAWVGSDDAICHIGTGLHTVPLARLQEVFLSALGKNRIELLEVIRVLGPFPNVKNILQGETKIDRGDVSTLQITYDSMVDGTGKEILAGTEDNIRRAGLQIYFSDEQVIVAAVPPEDGGLRNDLFEDGGKNVLVFIREPELDDKLETLRVL